MNSETIKNKDKSLYFKIMNVKENHHGYQYRDGLNVLDKEFDDDPYNHCSKGGLYFADGDILMKLLKKSKKE
ncbi:MAG: ankyrin repeat protein [Satyrvirus sp.]|uniref:Ankyrin repeat protein n=1 Tax=Satyrvirus sp. TaxID=2487771 RepID=A0A3G5AHJ2_9VIRU|nr:MAG: ankyrin repeat protein [Satyrvirus sp.]